MEAYTLQKGDDLIHKIMGDTQRSLIVSNVVGHLKKDVSDPVLQRAFEYWHNIDKEIGERIRKGVLSSSN